MSDQLEGFKKAFIKAAQKYPIHSIEVGGELWMELKVAEAPWRINFKTITKTVHGCPVYRNLRGYDYVIHEGDRI